MVEMVVQLLSAHYASQMVVLAGMDSRQLVE
jgi:hypothetical protein